MGGCTSHMITSLWRTTVIGLLVILNGGMSKYTKVKKKFIKQLLYEFNNT